MTFWGVFFLCFAVVCTVDLLLIGLFYRKWISVQKRNKEVAEAFNNIDGLGDLMSFFENFTERSSSPDGAEK